MTRSPPATIEAPDFLADHDLPARWARRAEFVMLATGFGAGQQFLAAWGSWQADPQRCQRLIFIAIEPDPLARGELEQAHLKSLRPDLAAQLCAAWPPLTANLHRLAWAGGRVQLHLCIGTTQHWLRELVAEVDAFCLNPQGAEPWDKYLFKALARHAAPNASSDSSPALREGLAAAGFSLEHDSSRTARFAPRHAVQKPVARFALAPQARHALIVGAGLAGAACAWALAERGIQSTVIDGQAGPAQAASGNPGGLFHGTLNPDDGLHARFNRACALETERVLKQLPDLPWRQQGLLRIETARNLAQMQALIERLGLPPDYVQALSSAQADARSGIALGRPAWFYPGGGALPPAAYVAALLKASGAQQMFGRSVTRLSRAAEGWQAWAQDGSLLGAAPLLVLAGGQQGQVLLQDLTPGLPLMVQRGQLSHIAPVDARPALPVAGLGFAIKDQGDGVWCGATSQDGDLRPDLLAADHARNLAQFAQLASLSEAEALDLKVVGGRVGWRLATPDRLPLVGGLPQPNEQGWPMLAEQLRFTPRQTGLAVCMGFGSRGIGWAALCAQVLAAQVSGAPCPLEASLLDAIDPARFALRAQRQPATRSSRS